MTSTTKLPGQLSGGQQQRVAIARAIVVEPPLVLMDEPLSNLDAKLRLEMRAEIRRIHTMLGCSTIYVTHDQEEALSLADRIMVMIDGQPRQIGTPEELYARPASADVAEFMGYRNLVTSPAADGRRAVSRSLSAARVSSARRWRRWVGARPWRSGRMICGRPPMGRSPRRWRSPSTTAAISMSVARGTAGEELYFRSDRRVAAGETVVHLRGFAERVLVYPA